MVKKLTTNQKIFVSEYIQDRNGTRAYRAAYPNCRTDNAAAKSAFDLLRNPKITQEIDKRIKALAEKNEITAQKVLHEEACIAFADILDLFNKGKPKPPHELPERIRKAISQLKVMVQPNGTITYEYRLDGKSRSLNRLHKHLGMEAPTKVDVEGQAALAERIMQARKRVYGGGFGSV